MEGMRVRLYFDDRHMLSKSQRLEGLKRCWLLLTPDIITISDLVSLVIHKFALEDACPNGLILSMDGFVLPEFESTCIFQDKDIVRVKKKGGTLKEIIRIDEEVNHIEDSGILDKQPLLNGVKLLTNEKFEEDTQSEHEEPLEDASDLERPLCASPVCKKKRKNSDKLQSSKRKKARPTTPEQEPMVSIQCLEKDVETQQNGSEHHKGGLSRRKVHKKDRLSNVNGRVNATIAPVINDSAENVDDSKSTDEGCVQFQEKSKKNAETSHVLDATRKLPSRSARRKKAKRQWLRGQKNSERKEVTQNSMLHKDMHKDSPEHTQTDPTTDMDDEIVPVVVRPGHIRFEPLDEGAEENNQQLQSQNAGVTLQWSGTTNKKKGQKWGKEKTSVCGKSDDDSVENCNEKSTVEEGELARDAVDFEKLMPLSGLPKEGDVIAYRLVELSSSWSPELSSFRVGKTSFYDIASNMVKLVSVPGYKMSNEELQSNISPYNEDGSLEINFASLFDVRIFIHYKSLPTTVITRTTGEDLVSAQEAEVGASFNCSAKDMAAPVTENGGMVKGKWDEISQALTEKKAQLMKRNGWGTKESSDKAAWSYKALRSSALGPTVALLRARNDLQA